MEKVRLALEKRGLIPIRGADEIATEKRKAAARLYGEKSTQFDAFGNRIISPHVARPDRADDASRRSYSEKIKKGCSGFDHPHFHI